MNVIKDLLCPEFIGKYTFNNILTRNGGVSYNLRVKKFHASLALSVMLAASSFSSMPTFSRQFQWLMVYSNVIGSVASGEQVVDANFMVPSTLPFVGANFPFNIDIYWVDFVTGSTNTGPTWTPLFSQLHDTSNWTTVSSTKYLTAGSYKISWTYTVDSNAGIEGWGPRREAQYGQVSDQRQLGLTVRQDWVLKVKDITNGYGG